LSTIIKRIDVLSPALLYPLACVLFVILGINGGSFYGMFLFFIHITFFLLSFFCTRIFLEKQTSITFEKSKTHEDNGFTKFLAVLFSVLGMFGFVVALSAVSWNVPAIYPWLRRYIPAVFMYASFLLVPACVISFQEFLLKGERKKAIFIFFSGLFSISILGYRTEVTVLLISSVLVLWYLQTEKKRLLQKTKNALLFFGMLAMAVLLISAISLARNSNDVLQRSSLTMGVLSMLTKHLEGGEGGGTLHYAIFSSAGILPGPKTGPRTFISLLVGVERGSTTSTILGLPFVDFGVGGVILFSVFLGAFFSFAYTIAVLRKNVLPMYAVCFAFLLVSIETGIADVIVIFYFFVLFAQCMREIFVKYKKTDKK